MRNVLSDVYGPILVVRPPVPVTVNKGGANYKSEVTHESYSPRRAYDEWLQICEGILALGGDAIFDFETEDDPFLDKGDLRIDPKGTILDAGGEVLGNIDEILTGRVFAANGPWVVLDGRKMRAVMPHMLTHRLEERPYYERLLSRIAKAGGYDLEIAPNPHRWEGMADIAVVGEKVVLTYAVPGHYDEKTGPKTERSSKAGVSFAADFVGVPDDARIFAELVFPHFHGDTLQFGARTAAGEPKLVHYAGGLWGDGAAHVARELGEDKIVPIGQHDTVEEYAGNSRQVEGGVLVPDGVSDAFTGSLHDLGLKTLKVPLFELFGKAGGGPACATLYLPRSLEIPKNSPLRYSVRRDEARARRERIPETVTVDSRWFEGRFRG
jgi:hypothetical protein